MSNQKNHWNKLHEKTKIRDYSKNKSSFANEVLKIISPESFILELGCGTGNDSVAFANAGHKVIATDFSEVAIKTNISLFKTIDNLEFSVLDISKTFPYKNNQFDLVYARLSLHYFDDITTQKIFYEINRILKPDGFLCFICKSVFDPLYGLGEKIENDMFEYRGHIRHFFSETSAKKYLSGLFEVKNITQGKDKFYERESAYIKVIAKSNK